tara:strand:- start:2698 stop:2946 length:249 start_codon:yes stop_codon:yes gene_type:complete
MGGVWGMNRVETINASTAVNRNNLLIKDLVESTENFAKNWNKTLAESLDYQVQLQIKYSTNDTARCAWEIRGEKAGLILGLK